MAGNKEIKHTIKLAGEKEYSAAIKEAQRNLKTLRSELKAETAELGANATAQDKNRVKAESLKKQIAEQEKVVKTLRKALEEAKRDYGDNEDVVQQWEQKLNQARTSLGYMRNDLANLGNEFRNVSTSANTGIIATKSFADSLASVASVGESISGAIEGIFTGMISTVKDVVADLWELIGDTAARANNWTDIAEYWNTDPAKIEQYARAIDSTKNSFGDLESVVTRIVLGGKSKEISEMLGVSDVNYTDQWDYAMAVLDSIYKLRQSGNLPENMWETIFGEKKATKVMDIVNDWAELQEGLKTFDADNGGFGTGTDALAQMNDIYVQMGEIEQKWLAIKDSVAAGLAPITAELLVNVSGSLDAINEFMKAETPEEKQAAIQKLEDNITEFFEKIAEALRAAIQTVSDVGKEFQGSDDPILKAIGDAMVYITDALAWFMDENNIDKVKAGVEAIFGVWLTTKLATVAGRLTSIISQIMVIKAFAGSRIMSGVEKPSFMRSGGGSAVESGGGAAAAGTPWWSKILAGAPEESSALLWGTGRASSVAALPSLGATATSALSSLFAASPAIMVAGAVGLEMYERSIYESDTEKAEAKVEAITESLDAIAESMNEVDTAQLEAVGALVEQLGDALSGQGDPAKVAAVLDALRESDLPDVITDNQMQHLNALYNGEEAFDYSSTQMLWDILSQMETHYRTLSENPTQYASATQQRDSETAGVFRGLPGQISRDMRNALHGIGITIDGVTVGRLVAPYVSQQIARGMEY